MIPFSQTSLPEWQRLVASQVNPLLQRTINVATKTAAYTISEGDNTIMADATTAAFTITLPKAALFGGRRFTIKKIDSSAHAVTIDGDGTETIDGAATVSLASQWAFRTVVSDGTAWFIISS